MLWLKNKEISDKLKQQALEDTDLEMLPPPFQLPDEGKEEDSEATPHQNTSRGSGRILPIALALLAIAAASPAMAQGRNWGEWREKKSRAVQAEIRGLSEMGLRKKSLCNELIRQGLYNVPVGMYKVPKGTPKYFNSQLQRDFYCPAIPGETALPLQK